ncbi:MAG: flagellin [Paracoccaceae bacterium]
MAYTSIGDLALTFQNRRQNVLIKTNLQRLSQELASGQKSDLSTDSAGDYAPIVGLERDLKANAAYVTATAEAGLFASTMQSALELVQANSSELGPAMLVAGTSESSTLIQVTAADARVKFSAVLSAFNARVADRYAFSGVATDSPALADVATSLADLQTAIPAETTATGVAGVVDAWFDDAGGGFEVVGYTGSDTPMADFRLSDDETAPPVLTAADPGVRQILKGFALAALIGEGALAGDLAERAALSRLAGETLMTSELTLATVRAGVGTIQAQIENVSARNAAERSALEIARSELTAVDPYKIATELEAVRIQLETLYMLTARLSQLNLASYLR